MAQASSELWRKSEIVKIDRFPSCFHAPILKGLQIMKGEIPNEESNEFKESDPDTIHFSEDDLNTLRDILGTQLVHGDHSLRELREIIEKSSQGRSSKFRRT
jgi:hypothetical protein